MNILAFDTCLNKTYVTLLLKNGTAKNKIIESDGENYHSAYLITTLVKILRENNLTPKDIDVVATDIGPGSFTGIRACTTVARVLTQQLSAKTVGVSSLEILSQILKSDDVVVLDARKNKAYVYDKGILGAVELEKVDEIVRGRVVITDNSLLERISKNAKKAISYEQNDYPLGEILALTALKKEQTDWKMLKPLYIQPPPVFGK